LNRPALATVAFSDEQKRATLNGIVHPLVAHRRSELIAAAAEEAVVVEDIPLLVESRLAPMFPLVVVVHADVETRLARLVEYRGFSETDARARIAAQATDEQRRAVADVWLDNSGGAGDVQDRARELWHRRIQPFARNLHARVPAHSASPLVPSDPSWPEQARRIVGRLNTACGHRALRIDHIGSTAVLGLDSEDVIDVQVTVDSLATADELSQAILDAGYPGVEHSTGDTAEPDGRSTVAQFDHSNDVHLWHKRFHASADPGRPTNVHIRVHGWPNQQFALLFTDWLSATPGVQAEYVAAKRFADTRGHPDDGADADAKEPWFLDAYRRAWEWADTTGWRPSGQVQAAG
jgi:dephospho-CoA kinase